MFRCRGSVGWSGQKIRTNKKAPEPLPGGRIRFLSAKQDVVNFLDGELANTTVAQRPCREAELGMLVDDAVDDDIRRDIPQLWIASAIAGGM